jgi:hypothetical protein
MDPRTEGRPGGGPRRPCWRATALAVALATAIGCAGSATAPGTGTTGAPTTRPTPAPEAKQQSPFPSRSEIQDLAKKAAPEDILPAPFVSVKRWKLEGPFPARVGEEPIQDPTIWEKLLLDVAAQRAGLVVASESMRCAARQFGRFYLEHSGYPDQSLQRTVLARCGATGIQSYIAPLQGTVPKDMSEAQVLSYWHENALTLLQKYLGAGPRAVGVWFGRSGEHALLMMASAPRRVRLDPVSPVPGADGAIHLSGEILAPGQGIQGMINHGAYGVAECQVDPSVALPRFALTCPTQHGDAAEWISVVARPPGRLLADPVLRVLARPTGAEAATYERPGSGRSVEIAGPKDFAPKLLAEVNRLRSELHAPPLDLEKQESAVADRLAPIFFGSYMGLADPAAADVVALGLMAGWDVRGPIQDAKMGSALAVDTTDLSSWLGEALTQPGMRDALLDPKVSRLAAGPVMSAKQQPYLGAVVATYAIYGKEDPAALRKAFYARVDEACAAHHVVLPRRDPETEAAAELLMARVRKGDLSPREALAKLLDDTTARLRSQASGWTLEGTSTGDVPLPDALFAGGVHRIAAAVGYTQPPDSPWGHTVVLLVDVPDVSMRAVQRQLPTSAGKLGSRSAARGARIARISGPGPGASSSTVAWSWSRSARLAAGAGAAGP